MRRTLHFYLFREILAPFLGALLFLTQLFVVMQLLAQADVIFGAGVPLLVVGKVVLYLLPAMLSYVLPVSFLLGILVGLGRLADDRELTALAATGHGPHVYLVTPLAMAAVLGGVLLALTTWLEPVGHKNTRALMNTVIKENLAAGVTPGTFYEGLSDLTLFAAEVEERGGRLAKVLVHDARDPDAPLLVLAERGRIDTSAPGGAIVLQLEEGELHRAEGDADGYALAEFARAKVSVSVEEELSRKNKSHRPGEVSTSPELAAFIERRLSQGRYPLAQLVEYHRRFAHPFVMVAFALVGVAAGGTAAGSRKGGKAIAFGWTLGAVVAYFVLGKVGNHLADHFVPPFVGAWIPVATLVVAALAFFAWRRTHGGAS
jgi:lipopolysaccharide export system permease protein